MALLSDTFTELCTKHDLVAASISIQNYGGRFGYNAYAHWLDGYEVQHCESAHADTPELAISGAIEKANATRYAAPSIEPLEVEL